MMDQNQESLQILKMIENGQITSEEGLQLIEALGSNVPPTSAPPRSQTGGKMLRIRVLDPDEDTKVNVNLPIALIKVLAEVGIQFIPKDRYPDLENVDIAQILNLIDSGISGKIVDVQSASGANVEIYIE